MQLLVYDAFVYCSKKDHSTKAQNAEFFYTYSVSGVVRPCMNSVHANDRVASIFNKLKVDINRIDLTKTVNNLVYFQNFAAENDMAIFDDSRPITDHDLTLRIEGSNCLAELVYLQYYDKGSKTDHVIVHLTLLKNDEPFEVVTAEQLTRSAQIDIAVTT